MIHNFNTMEYRELVELKVCTKLIYFVGKATVERMTGTVNLMATSIQLAVRRLLVLTGPANISLADKEADEKADAEDDEKAAEVMANTRHDEHTNLVPARLACLHM